MNTPSLPTCPKCGLALPADAPQGLCPRCLAAMNFATETVLTGADAVAAQPPLSPAELAPHFPQLEIIGCLGRGGMGVVYKARQKSLNRFVALKLLAPERVTDSKFAERFTREAHALAALNHPCIVTIYDFGQAGGFYFLLMEFVDGVNLRQAMSAGRFTPEQALAIVPPVCEALQYAHEHGIVHRDIKPENLLLDKEGRVKIADFGVAKILDAEEAPVPGLAESQPAGTPQYMAPEQKAHRATDHRTDIYSLGVVLYEMLTGELPADKLQPPSKRVQVDVRIDELVLRALEKTPELRYQTATEFRTQVETIASAPGSSGRESAPSESTTESQSRLTSAATGKNLFSPKAIAIAALALIIGAAAGLLVADGAPPPLVIMAFAGIAAFLTMVTLLRQRLQSGAVPHPASDVVTGPPRFSRAAIVGACWVPVAFVAFIGAYLMLDGSRRGLSPSWWQLAVIMPLLAVAVSGPFGTTILGWLAVSTIRRSAGRILGLPLALFDGLVFPLMTLNAVIALAGVALAKMFADFFGNLSLIGNPAVRPPLLTSLANGLSQNVRLVVLLSVAVAIVVDVLIVRAVLRAVRKSAAAAPSENSATGNEIKLASIAILFALMSTALGGLAAIRAAGAWPAMALAFLFAGIAIFMALPVRRIGAGMSAIFIATLGMILWPLVSLITQQSHTVVIENVVVAEDEVKIHQTRYDREALIITFGPHGHRWFPSGVYLEAMFDITLKPDWLGGGATWVLKPRHGIHSSYRLDGPPGPMLGRILFHPTSITREPDGTTVIGEFRPQEGDPLPIAIELERDLPASPVPAGEQPEPARKDAANIPAANEIPRHIDFKVAQVEHPPGSRSIALRFERDPIYGLGLEVSQEMIASPDGKTPAPGYRDFQAKVFVGEHGANTLAWQLPEEFTPEEAERVAKEVEATARRYPQLNDGALIEFARAKHRDGWTYVLLARVRREPGAAHPPAPAGATYTIEQGVFTPSECVVRLNLTARSSLGLPIGAPLVFKTARDSIPGFLLRVSAYDAPGESPSRVLIDVVDGKSGVIHHRFEHRFGANARFMPAECHPLPDKNPPVILGNPAASSATQMLIAAETIAPSGATIPQRWEIVADIAILDDPQAVPHFQIPPANKGTSPDAALLSPANVTRTFGLRHMLARNMAVALRQVFRDRADCKARATPDDRTVVVTAPPEVMTRVQTFIVVNDATDTLAREGPHGYPQETPLVTARVFLHACAIEETDDVISDLLSAGVLAQLRGDESKEFQEFQTTGVADLAWESTLRGNWPGKPAKLRELVREWNRYPLQSLAVANETAATAKPVVSAVFAGEVGMGVIRVSRGNSDAVPGVTKGVPRPVFHIESLPPWWTPLRIRQRTTEDEEKQLKAR